MRLSAFRASAAALALAVAACHSTPTARLASLGVEADPDANGGNATALDIVFAFTPEAVAALPATGPEWFERRAALQADLAASVAVVHVELPPGIGAAVTLPPHHRKAVGVYSFANYIPAPGQARGNLTPYPRMTIRLENKSVSYLQR